MTNHLANALRGYLERSSTTAISLETSADLPSATISRIFSGRHPRQATMSSILRAVPPSEVWSLLRAYLLDDCPDDWEHRIEIMLDDSHTASPRTQDELDLALEGLRQAALGDAGLRSWLIDSARIMRLIPRSTETKASAPVSFAPASQPQHLARVAEDAPLYRVTAPATAGGAPPAAHPAPQTAAQVIAARAAAKRAAAAPPPPPPHRHV